MIEIRHLIVNMRWKQLLLITVSIILLASSVSAYMTIYNPFTGRLDYVQGGNDINFTGMNITLDNVTLVNVKACSSDLQTDALGRIYCGADETGAGGKGTDGIYLYNSSTIFYFNATQMNITIQQMINDNLTDYVPYEGATSDIDFNDKQLTGIGGTVIDGILQSQDIYPTTTNLYAIGNNTNWYKEAYITTIYNKNLYSENINASTLNADNMTSKNITSDDINIDKNLTFGGHQINKEGDDLVIRLT